LKEGKDALPWITRALERNPTSAEAYVELARILHARGATNQALGAFQRSIELQPARAPQELALGRAWGVAPATLAAAAVPQGAAGAEVLLLLAYQTQDFALRVQLLERALERQPGLSNAHHQLAIELLEDTQRGAAGAVCAAQRETCLLRALEHARRGSQPGSSREAVLEAKIRAEQQQPREAEEQLARACQELPMDVACNDALVDLALRNSSERLPDAVRRLVAVACVDRERCATAQLNLGRKFAAAGQWNVALGHYEQAAKELPSVDTWGAVASTAQQLGQRTLADDALRRVRVLEAAAAPESPPKESLPAGAQLLEHEVQPTVSD
jgi:tetratricopeptide (TPR) repeat protein